MPRAPLDLPVAEVRHSWGSSPGCEFNVRVGPNYKKFGKKEPSLPAFYDLVAFDFIRTQNVYVHSIPSHSRDSPEDRILTMQMDMVISCGRVDHVASFMAMEQVESEVEGDPPADVPRIFVVNCQLPEGEPPMFNAPEDGPGELGATQRTCTRVEKLKRPVPHGVSLTQAAARCSSSASSRRSPRP